MAVFLLSVRDLFNSLDGNDAFDEDRVLDVDTSTAICFFVGFGSCSSFFSFCLPLLFELVLANAVFFVIVFDFSVLFNREQFDVVGVLLLCSPTKKKKNKSLFELIYCHIFTIYVFQTEALLLVLF